MPHPPPRLITLSHRPGSPKSVPATIHPNGYLQLQRVRAEDQHSVLAATPQPPTHRDHLGDGAPLSTQGHRFEVLGVPETTWSGSGVKKTANSVHDCI